MTNTAYEMFKVENNLQDVAALMSMMDDYAESTGNVLRIKNESQLRAALRNMNNGAGELPLCWRMVHALRDLADEGDELYNSDANHFAALAHELADQMVERLIEIEG